MKRITALFILFAFLLNTVLPPSVLAQALTLPQPGTMVKLSPAFTPAHLKGMVINPNNPFKFDFIIYRGDEPLSEDQKQPTYTKLIKYFLAALAVPDTDQWVNLSPFEQNRIIPDNFGFTEMGRDLLSQDYILKQLAASLTNPDSDLGKRFWNSVYEQAYQKFGTTEVPTDIINKVWIIPDKAVVYEKGNTVYVLENHLKVMMEKDYLAAKVTETETVDGDVTSNVSSPSPSEELTQNIMREVIIPAIEKEVNEGKNFAQLRQVYSGMLLATWYKRALKESILGKLYADQGKVKGIDQDPKTNQEIYNQYVEAFKKGVFNMIKEDVDQYTQEVIPRKYFSGGTVGFINGYQAVRDVNPTQAEDVDQAMSVADVVTTAFTTLALSATLALPPAWGQTPGGFPVVSASQVLKVMTREDAGKLASFLSSFVDWLEKNKENDKNKMLSERLSFARGRSTNQFVYRRNGEPLGNDELTVSTTFGMSSVGDSGPYGFRLVGPDVLIHAADGDWLLRKAESGYEVFFRKFLSYQEIISRIKDIGPQLPSGVVLEGSERQGGAVVININGQEAGRVNNVTGLEVKVEGGVPQVIIREISVGRPGTVVVTSQGVTEVVDRAMTAAAMATLQQPASVPRFIPRAAPREASFTITLRLSNARTKQVSSKGFSISERLYQRVGDVLKVLARDQNLHDRLINYAYNTLTRETVLPEEKARLLAELKDSWNFKAFGLLNQNEDFDENVLAAVCAVYYSQNPSIKIGVGVKADAAMTGGKMQFMKGGDIDADKYKILKQTLQNMVFGNKELDIKANPELFLKLKRYVLTGAGLTPREADQRLQEFALQPGPARLPGNIRLSSLTTEEIKDMFADLFVLWGFSMPDLLNHNGGSPQDWNYYYLTEDAINYIKFAKPNGVADAYEKGGTNGTFLTPSGLPTMADRAATAAPGGIDLNAASLDLQIKRDGNGVPLPVSQQNLDNIKIDGLVPVILDIKPAVGLPLFSELADSRGGGNA